MTVSDSEIVNEDEVLTSLVSNSKEQLEFDNLTTDTKLSKLDALVQKSQIYSKIIAENLLQNMQQKKTVDQKKKQKKTRGKVVEENRQPKLLTGATMRDYQLDGLDFLVSLYENGLNGILADEMGLGKTIQCISFISFLMEQGITGPFLVVAPLSTVGNWSNEFRKFAPKIKVLEYIGSKDTRNDIRLSKKVQTTNVILTSYEISIRDHSFLKNFNWKFLLVDEGHRLKNSKCLLIQKLKELDVSNRLLITGTPLQNNLDELWSLLNFILPDIFHDLQLFQQWFNFDELTNLKKDTNNEFENKLIELNIQKSLIENLHTILKPFILRRLKKDVIKNLPPKKEYIVYVNLSTSQRYLYQETLNGNLYNTLVRVYFKDYIENNYKGMFRSSMLDTFLDESLSIKQLGAKRRKITKKVSLLEEASDDEFQTGDGLDGKSDGEEDLEQEEEQLAKLSPSQRKQFILNKVKNKVIRDLKNKSLQNMLMQLRNICNSPYIFYEPFPIQQDHTSESEEEFIKLLNDNSSKMQVFEQLIDSLLEKNHKILVFSQFTRMLDLLNDWFNFHGIEVCRLDGSNSQSERQETIESFNTKNGPPVFLLSTRAGGLGINLTTADTVILFDSDWNPQIDLQAIDRAHRIGQVNPVKIYRFVVRDSIEEVLLYKSYSKIFLNKLIIQMNEHKTQNIESLLDGKELQNSDILTQNLKNLIELPKAFAHKFESNSKIKHENLLSEDELNELLDRSAKCYEDGNEKTFKNITVFETINNMEQ
ncbi:uncharacterized ATP-dependent helicase Irc5p [[Candida] anglica]|uniref:Uncharacterized ATP-dependent helicase Irc5p n=1 Tax=[Candida] anglica TaxID=148631 RepID=A0ABP0EBB0_9ASCO